jgi:hypothetical protein
VELDAPRATLAILGARLTLTRIRRIAAAGALDRIRPAKVLVLEPPRSDEDERVLVPKAGREAGEAVLLLVSLPFLLRLGGGEERVRPLWEVRERPVDVTAVRELYQLQTRVGSRGGCPAPTNAS